MFHAPKINRHLDYLVVVYDETTIRFYYPEKPTHAFERGGAGNWRSTDTLLRSI